MGTCLASDSTDPGIEMYEAGHLEQAKQYFQSEISANPKNASAHYLLANVLVKLKQIVDAQSEYEKAEQLDPHGPVGRYSRSALSSFSPTSSVSNTALPLDHKEATVTSVKEISKEVTGLERQQQAACDARVRAIYTQADAKVKQLEDEMQSRIAENGPLQYVNSIVPKWGGGYKSSIIVTYDPGPDNEAIRQDYNARIDRIKEKARQEADELIESCKSKAVALEDSAVMLDKSYINNKNGNVRLAPTGSNIYARNYQTADTASGNPVPVVAAPAKLLPGIQSAGRTTH